MQHAVKKPQIAVLGLGLELYDRAMPGLTARRLDALSLPGRQETIVAYVIEAGAPGA